MTAARSTLRTASLFVPLRGTRPYVQSASIINSLLPYVVGYDTIVFRFSRLIHAQHLFMTFLPADDETPESAGCDVWWSSPGGRGKAYLSEAAGPDLGIREDYPEAKAIEGWQVTESGAEVPGGYEFTFADRLVALNKAYLSALFPLGEGERYLATRMEFSRQLAPSSLIRVEHFRTIAEKHYISRIYADRVAAGTIYFARQPS